MKLKNDRGCWQRWISNQGIGNVCCWAYISSCLPCVGCVAAACSLRSHWLLLHSSTTNLHLRYYLAVSAGTACPRVNLSYLLELSKVTGAMNDMLLKPTGSEEVKNALFRMFRIVAFSFYLVISIKSIS